MQTIFASSAFKFASVGVLNTLLSLAIIFTLKRTLDMPDAPANLIGYIAGLVSSFSLNKRWTFQHSAHWARAFVLFLVVFGVSYLLNIATVLTVIHLGVNDYFAHLFGIPVYSITFYLGCRQLAFAPARASAAVANISPMQAAQPPAEAPGVDATARLGTGSPWTWLVATLLFAAAVLLYRLGELPIAVWDEARLANNALEMANSGWSLVTTYGGVPDHWNTKPPLQIWAMASAIDLLGPTEWAVRLPSVVAALATAALLFGFCAWYLKRPVAGFIAVVLLHATPGYILFHGARSGDYESMLTLWTVVYLLAGYLLLHDRPERRRLWITVCAVGVLLSFLTKTVQGMIMLPALFVFAVFSRKRMIELLRWPGIYVAGLLTVAVCVGYYLLREHVDPGYLNAVHANDLVGRYATALERHVGAGLGVFFYVAQVKQYPWLVPSLLVAAYQLWRGSKELRQITLLLLIASLFYLGVISLGGTKLVWYATPLSPLSALLVALAATDLLERADLRSTWFTIALRRTHVVLCGLAAIVVVTFNASKVSAAINARAADELDAYSYVLREAQFGGAGPHKLAVIHPGYPNNQGDPFYIAPTLFYANALKMAGHSVVVLSPSTPVPTEINTVIACGAARNGLTRLKSIHSVVKPNKLCSLYQLTHDKGVWAIQRSPSSNSSSVD